jgi:hypothetical protein
LNAAEVSHGVTEVALRPCRVAANGQARAPAVDHDDGEFAGRRILVGGGGTDRAGDIYPHPAGSNELRIVADGVQALVDGATRRLVSDQTLVAFIVGVVQPPPVPRGGIAGDSTRR